jgi:cytolysin (calcineurin-like family phosphatase)
LSSAQISTALGGQANSTVGVAKTAYKAGVSATSVEANALIMVKDTSSLGTVTDNQFRFLEAVDAQNNKTGSVKFQYDTNPAAGTTTLSDVVAINLISADALSTFLASSTSFKVI